MQKMLSLMRRCVEDYNMIETGDKIAVGVSGGKDSLSALFLLAALRNFYPQKFELIALTLDMGIEGMDFSRVSSFCENIGVEYYVKKTDIAHVIFDIRKEKNPCSLCAKMRRGGLNDWAIEKGCNKVALGHHNDDAVETFFLSLFYEGRLNCFSPVTYLNRVGITQIRPLVYIKEEQIKNFVKNQKLPVVLNPCPANGYTKRQEIKKLIEELKKDNPALSSRVFGALQRSGLCGWETKRSFTLEVK
jgi:tRNA 2-thiocytidine biosynthesis protein TtcA